MPSTVLLLEALALQYLGVIESVGYVTQRQRVLSPMPEQHREDDKGTDEVNKDTAEDDKQSLPRRLGAELPVLRFGRKVFGFVGLVHHTCDGAVTAERQPADTPFGILRMCVPLGVFILGKHFDMPFAVEFLEADETNPGVEEHIEFLYADVKYLREGEMSQLVNQHEKGER